MKTWKTIGSRLKMFCKSLVFHIWSGLPKSTKKQIHERFVTCFGCDKYDNIKSQCLVCGCNVNNKKVFLNKLAWADQECPLGKWGKIK